MIQPTRPSVCFLVLVCSAWLSLPPAGAAEAVAPAAPRVLKIEDHRQSARPVRSWDAASPQRLVRIDGVLYQQGDASYFPVVPDRITVRLADGLTSWEDLLAQLATANPQAFELLSDLEALRTNRLGIVDLSAPTGTDLVELCDLVHRTGLVRYAEVATWGTYLATQNDPLYADQWALRNTGQTGGNPGADVDAERAWDLTAGVPAVVVAILDSGTDVDHEDLAANVWHNDGEIPDNGIDDDGNGYVDDWEGWDFDNDDNDPRPTFYHGTHVTGIVNAAGSNGIGIAGLAGGLGGPGVRGMALNVGQGAPNASVLDEAILYAADNGAHVITLSLSVGETQAINDALDYAYNTKDVFIDSAAGNSGSSVSYPATRPEVMAVGSTDANDLGSGFSNPGPEVEVAAPGSSVLSTGIGDTYDYSDGTSFAAPYVGALAGLIRSRNPGLSAPDVRQLIIDTAEDVELSGFDDKTGHGRINAFEAVSLAATSAGTLRLDAAEYACEDGINLTLSDIDLAGAGTTVATVRSDTETAAESIELTETSSSSGLFRGSVTTTAAAAAEDGVLQVADGDTIVAEYLDADDGMGGTDVVRAAEASVDCRAPAISGVQAQGISATSATIVWSTDEPSTSVVHYGPIAPSAAAPPVAGLTTQHLVSLDGLERCTTYRYEVESGDAQANTTVDDNGGTYHTFETYGDYPGIGIVPCHQGQVLLDRAGAYGCSATVGITVNDTDLDQDPGSAETVKVLLTSTSEPGGEWVNLLEIGSESSRFEGSIPLDTATAIPGDGRLAVGPGDLITATYYDGDDGAGRPYTAIATSTADCSAPSITDVRISEISATRAVVEWTTDEPATSRVDFGSSVVLGSVVQDPAPVTTHRLPISAFEACERVHFRVTSADVHGNVGVADAGGAPLALNLNRIGGLVFHDNFETESGWQLPGEWERGTPQALGTNNADPAAAWSGSHVIGNDLSGQGTFRGDYEPATSESAFSPVFNARRMRNLELIIRRKLGVTSADEAGIYVVTGGTDQVWTSTYQSNDPDWVLRSFDISAFADNQQSVQLEFRLVSTGLDHSFGWNLDEIIVKDATEPDYLVCGGCAGAPAFGGVVLVYDPDPCGPGGLIVRWSAASAWGSGTDGTYDVHRGSTADFVPDASNRVASGLAGTSWTDSLAPTDTPVWYVVRARNDEPCEGGEGLADANVVRLGATETTSRPLPAEVGATLVSERVGGAHVRLEWQPVAGASHYVIRRGSLRDFSDALEVGTSSTTVFEDPLAATSGESYSYRVFAVDACDREE